tara:strand:+ start:426 stop:1433 length:1008 start_codon:yes stop_codon:yes gene_type:complete
MPRTGRHPLKEKKIIEDQILPNTITIATIVYIPTLSNYWSNALEVLKLFFESLEKNTSHKYDLMVFDNGSCSEVVKYLTSLNRNGVIQYYIRSDKNLRKLGALNYLLKSAPGDYVSFADSDVYFLDGWLDKSLEVLKKFPEAGKVTALPIAGGDTTLISSKFYELANQDASIKVKTGSIIPDEYIEAHNISIGKTLKDFNRKHPDRKDIELKRGNIQAYLSGADFQFTIRRDAIKDVLPLIIENSQDYYDPIYSPILEKKLDRVGWWQLSTKEYLVHHMGNEIPNINKEIHWMNDHSSPINKGEGKRKKKVIQNRILRYYLKKINNYLYRLLYEG